jgi:hypothetical protein
MTQAHVTKPPIPVPKLLKELSKRRGGKWVILKQFLGMEAIRLGITDTQAFSRWKKGMYKDYPIHWENKRVVCVKIPA